MVPQPACAYLRRKNNCANAIVSPLRTTIFTRPDFASGALNCVGRALLGEASILQGRTFSAKWSTCIARASTRFAGTYTPIRRQTPPSRVVAGCTQGRRSRAIWRETKFPRAGKRKTYKMFSRHRCGPDLEQSPDSHPAKCAGARGRTIINGGSHSRNLRAQAHGRC